MFCPDALVWGTVANWVSGLATTFAASVALTVALWNWIKDRKDKQAAKLKEAETENALLTECLFLYRSIRQASQDVLDQFVKGEISFNSWKFVLQDARERALRLQQLPGANLRAFKELEQVVRTGSHAEEIRMMDMPDVETLLGAIVHRCDHISAEIIQNPNGAAPLNW
ncbi:hypothetical protein IFT54_05575 [Sphingomonas sp. CFBP 13714]|uniref:hypothetical protein n=1 Tax=Sphingomonas sp. CFBP 13714 TaxID=2775308 RepID=UPI00177FDAB2|nr:hypothetical protein [Sphingomonas sp. CFBP 13714]MBD8699285.1 hypothetical protein [Sphingomonas sp. CFBP 13714]